MTTPVATKWVNPMAPDSYTISRRLTIGHRGIDMAAPIGTPYMACGVGTVVDAGPASGFGNWIRIAHDEENVGSVYGHSHLNQILVRRGQRVTAGQVIARVGNEGRSSGPHLHFELRVGGVNGLPVDGLNWLANKGAANIPAGAVSADNGVQQIGFNIPGLGTVNAAADFVQWVTNPHNWLRMAMFVLGGALLFLALKGMGYVPDVRKMASDVTGVVQTVKGAAK